MISDIHNFGAVTTFVGDEATVTLRGRVVERCLLSVGSPPRHGHQSSPRIGVDLSELEFIGAAGMMAVANAEKRLYELGVRLTVRSPSELVNRLLSIMGEAEISRLDRHVASEEGHREAVPRGEAPALPRPGAPGGPLRDLRKVTSMPTDPDVVDGALRLVVELARALVQGADGVSVSLLRHGRLSTVAASDQTIMDMDADQYATGEGPCVDASLQGNRFHAEVLATETRWPAFTPRALVAWGKEFGRDARLGGPCWRSRNCASARWTPIETDFRTYRKALYALCDRLALRSFDRARPSRQVAEPRISVSGTRSTTGGSRSTPGVARQGGLIGERLIRLPSKIAKYADSVLPFVPYRAPMDQNLLVRVPKGE
jgi:hypothetical protein